MAVRYAVDTNVLLLRLSYRDHPRYSIIETALRRLVDRDVELCFTPQNLGEFWNVSTRPRERNGFGLSSQETEVHVRAMERILTLLPDDEGVYQAWRQMLLLHDVRGVQVHDAHLAAALMVHEVSYLLTFNGADFKRYSGITPVHPEAVEP